MKHILLIILTIFSPLLLAACYGVPVEPVPYEEALPVPPDAEPSPVGLHIITLAIPRGDTVGSASPRGLGILCRGPYGMITRTAVAAHVEKTGMRESFYDTMRSIGYDVTGSPSLMFDEDEDEARTIYRIGARITDIKMDVCQRTTLLFAYDLGYTGEGSMEVEWTVYDRLKRETVYKTVTRGYSKMDLPNYEAIGLMLDDSFAAAAHNLGADERFHDMVVRGIKPGVAASGKREPVYGPVTKFDPREAVVLEDLKRRTSPLRLDDIERIRKVAVQIGTGNGHGSGFFITTQGHILTNNHVVGNADRVRVATADQQYKLVGEVLRRDPARDIALIRVEDMPEDFKPFIVPVRSDLPKVGEPVYAIGSPQYEKKAQDTVTHGIVSAYRDKDARNDGQPYLQADVTIHPGSSGGPLLDGNGNIIGISTAGYVGDRGESLNLNFFVPIGDGLRKIDVSGAGN